MSQHRSQKQTRKQHPQKVQNSKNTPKERRSLPEWLAVRLDIPPDVLRDGMRLEMRGQEFLIVHGCRRITGYEPTCICLSLKSCTLTIRGCRLVCTSYLGGAVGIDGHIDGLSFDDPTLEGSARREGRSSQT